MNVSDFESKFTKKERILNVMSIELRNHITGVMDVMAQKH